MLRPPRPLTAALVATALALGAAACGDDGGGGDAAADDDTGGEVTSGGITVSSNVGEEPDVELGGQEAVTELEVVDIVTGTGDEVPAGATVTVDYAGYLLDGTVFDSSFANGNPATFPLDGVIAGWTEGIPGMQVGGRRLLVIPSDLAYGPSGQGPIPPDATLVFVVDLVSFVP